jgi:hypothetical protein
VKFHGKLSEIRCLVYLEFGIIFCGKYPFAATSFADMVTRAWPYKLVCEAQSVFFEEFHVISCFVEVSFSFCKQCFLKDFVQNIQQYLNSCDLERVINLVDDCCCCC